MRPIISGAKALALASALAGFACGGRPERWDAPLPDQVASLGLSGSVAVRDDPLHRVLMLTAPGERRLEATALSVGKNPVHWTVGPQRRRLFVLSAGVEPRKNPGDEQPSLTVIEGGGLGVEPFVVARYFLDDPPDGIYIDPEEEYAAVTSGGGLAENPNELLLVKLPPADATEPLPPEATELTPKTMRSFGSSPQDLVFLPRMRYPDRDRRFLVVRTEQEVSLIDLEEPGQEVTIKLSEPLPGQVASRPLEVIYHDNQPDELGLPEQDARYPLIAIRTANESTIPFLSFEPRASGNDSGDDPIETKDVDFEVAVNLAEVGGVPTDIEFLWTEVDGDAELRLAATLASPVEGTYRAALVDPIANRTDFVDVDAAYTNLTRVTDEAKADARVSDIALLWGPNAGSIAFWELGSTGSEARRSIEAYPIDIGVTGVTPVTQDGTAPSGEEYDHRHLRILQRASNDFYVLDLQDRQTSPIFTRTEESPILSLSPDGQRAWIVGSRQAEFASLRFSDLHPVSLVAERPVTAVYDIVQRGGEGERAAFVLHGGGESFGVTVLDAVNPDTADTRFYAGILLGGL